MSHVMKSSTDARQEEPGATEFEIFQANAEVMARSLVAPAG
jgi:hypothetical protein